LPMTASESRTAAGSGALNVWFGQIREGASKISAQTGSS